MNNPNSTFGLQPYNPDNSLPFHERKRLRTEYYFKYVYRNKLIECIACSGYSYYCGEPCGICSGKGVQRQNHHYW
ncbi:hypothetical protein [Photobacterium leiognathi]|uniref:hypothetical protein n=1 Tax=Photobacterium leiognathi TaxID=553611 RepID=UPI002982794D|nr:hypothetical protein [Photobacterium leiognathi]